MRTPQIGINRENKCVAADPVGQNACCGLTLPLQQNVPDGGAIEAERHSFPQLPILRGLAFTREQQGDELQRGRGHNMTAFHHGAACLLGCNLDQIGFAQLQRNHLIAEAFAHLDGDGIDEGAPIPISFFSLQCEFLARLPVRNLEGSGAEDLASGRALGNGVPWQREFP